MLIPLTHERTNVRSLPWVSIAILVLCLAVFAYMRSQYDLVEASDQAFDAAISYFAEHPYLEPDPRLVPPSGVETLRDAFGSVRGPAALPQLEQRRLDDLTAAWLASLEHNPAWKLGIVPDDIRPLGTVAHMFTHVGWLHLLGNLFFFYLTAPFVEDRLGRLPFALFWIAAGVVAGLVQCLHYPELSRPMIGASGAISATMGAFLVFFGRTRIRLLVILVVVPRIFLAPAWLVFPFWFLLDLSRALVSSWADPSGVLTSVGYWAHVAGFVVGVGVAFVHRLVAAADPEDRDVAPASLEAVTSSVSRAVAAHRSGNSEEGWRLLEAEARRLPDSAPVIDAYWEMAVELGRTSAAAGAMQRRIRNALRAGDGETAAWAWSSLDRYVPQAARRPDLAVAVGEALLGLGRRLEGEELLRGAAGSAGPDTPIGLLMKLLRLAGRVDPALRRQVAVVLSRHPQTPPEVREQVSGELVMHE